MADNSRADREANCDGDPSYVVPGLRRGLQILQLLGRGQPSITVAEIIRELSIPRATAFRIVKTLEHEGYLLRQKHSTALKLGPQVLNLGFKFLHSQDVIEVARPLLELLRDSVEASGHLGILQGREVLYVLRAPSRQRLSSNRFVGSRLPAHSSSLGRALLLDHSPDEIRHLFAGCPMEAEYKNTPGDSASLIACLLEERRVGYVSGQFAEGIISVAAPVRDESGKIVAAINVSDYQSAPCMGDVHGALKNAVLATSLEISRRLGYSG